jgi:hypothetical protein
VPAYRDAHQPPVDLEAEALRELLRRTRRLRKRVVFPALAAAIVVGHLGIAAHATGRWALLGSGADGSYYVSPLTILLAFALPALPFVLAAGALHRVLGDRLRRAWCDEYEKEHGLPRDVLEGNALRYG